MQDILKSTSFERLKGILKSHYDKDVEMSFLNDSHIIEESQDSFLMKEGALHIPIQSHGHFLGIAKIPNAHGLPATSQNAIAEIVRLIMEPALYNAYLVRLQGNGSHTLESSMGLHIVDATESDVMSEVERSPVILISSKNPHRIARVAQQAHEAMNRWAFVHWSEIKSQIRTSKDLRDLGAMTVFVEDVMLLSDSEKIVLENWHALSHADSQPALILGTTQSWAELREHGSLPARLLDEAGYRQILADRLPADRRFCEEAIQLLLDKEATLQS